MRIHRLTADEALLTLASGSDGLSDAEAQRRLLAHGRNTMAPRERLRPAALVARELTQLFSLVLWAAAALAFVLERVSPGQGMARLGAALVAVIVVSALFSFWQEFRAERTLEALTRLLPSRVRVTRACSVREVHADSLVPGDIVLLAAGDTVPADCRVIECYAARVNAATVTGESLPQPCRSDAGDEDDPLRARNLLLAGTTLLTGRVRAVVFATGMHTVLGAIGRLTERSGQAASPLRLQIAHLSRTIVLVSLGMGAAFFAAGHALGVPLWQDFIFAIGVIVAMVPEGLLPTLTLALVLAGRRMAKRNVLIRHLPAVEALGAVTVICTDKTGTLTQNRMAVRAVALGAGAEVNAETARGAALVAAHRPFYLAAALCNDVEAGDRDGVPVLLGDPMETALVELARDAVPALPAGRRVRDVPFDAQRMRLSTVYAFPDGEVLYCKGALETVLPLCDRIEIGGRPRALDAERRAAIGRAEASMAERGLRVLAFAYRPLREPATDGELERELVYCGLAGLEDPPREGVADAVERCRCAGIRVIMVTGDHPGTAAAIAREIGLVSSSSATMVSGETLRRLSDAQLRDALGAPEIVFARVSPEQKHRIVEALKAGGETVAVTGDGVNDAPALRSAHVGVAMGVCGTDVARSAADIVLLDDNFASIVDGIEEGRAVFENIRKFLTYILAHNVPELMPYFGYALFGLPLALTPMQILAIDMGTDSLSALGLGAEKPEPGIMGRPPRARDAKLFDRPLALRAYLRLGLIEGVGVMAIFLVVLACGGWSYGQPLAPDAALYLQATTACLVAVVVMQSANVFLCRSARRSVLAVGVRGNGLIGAGTAFGAGLAILIAVTPQGNAFFGTAPIAPELWLLALPFAAALIVVDEAMKARLRRREGRARATAAR